MPRLIALALIWLLCCGFGPNQKPLLGTQLNRSHPLAQGLVGAWLMNEGSGSVVNDASGNGNVGVNTAAWVAGGLACVTTSRVVSTKQFFNSLSTAAVTVIGFWAYPGTSNSDLHTVGADMDFRVRHGTSTSIQLLTNGGTNNLSVSIPDISVARKITFTSIGSPGGLKMYVDGGKQSGSNMTAWNGATGTLAVTGALLGTPAAGNAVVYAVFVHSRALSPSEISWLHRDPYAMFARPVMSKAYLNFGSGGAPAPAPARRRGQAIIIGKAGRQDIIAWVKDGAADDYWKRKAVGE